MHIGIVYACLAAVTFGASTPFAKILAGEIAPVMLAGLLYMGSGLGLMTWFACRAAFARSPRDASARLTRNDMPWLGGAILFGGVAGPVLLMLGLTSTPASTASLLLNMEGVATAVLAWCVFKENVDRRILLGMVFIVMGGIVLSWGQRPALGVPWGAIAILGACLCWGIDNNLTRKISGSDAVQIAGIKGLVSGAVSLAIAMVIGQPLPAPGSIAIAAMVGLCGYGLSLVFFVLALRNLGTARTGAYFSIAPFVGAAISLVLLGDAPGSGFWLAVALMAAGIWLHLSENHAHAHTHMPMAHAHPHIHDAHHQHEHDFQWDGVAPHLHEHAHVPMTHEHAHVPDIHHRHGHQRK